MRVVRRRYDDDGVVSTATYVVAVVVHTTYEEHAPAIHSVSHDEKDAGSPISVSPISMELRFRSSTINLTEQ